MGAVYAGWLTKSPEDRKGLFSLFAARQQWRRRYFVLYTAPMTSSSSASSSSSSSSSSSTEETGGGGTWTSHVVSSFPLLVYYEDEAMTVQKGIIDLENCEEIVDHVESCYYRHLFLLKAVTQRGRQRTYYLAADSSDDVSNWVKKLHSTLNLYEDKLFTNTVLSVTKSGSDVTGIIATVSNLEVNSQTSKTNTKKKLVNESLASAIPKRQLSHVHCLIVNSESPPKCLDLQPGAGLCDSNSGISVSNSGTKATDRNAGPPFKPNVSAETRSYGPVSVDNNSVGSSSSSASSPAGQSSALQNDVSSSSSGNACTGQTGAHEYFEDWPQFVKKLLDDVDEPQGTEKDDGREGKVEGKSIFYVCKTSSFLQDTKANPQDAHKGQRPNLSESNDEAPECPSTSQPSSDVTCYLRITKGSRRYKRGKKRIPQDIPAQF